MSRGEQTKDSDLLHAKAEVSNKSDRRQDKETGFREKEERYSHRRCGFSSHSDCILFYSPSEILPLCRFKERSVTRFLPIPSSFSPAKLFINRWHDMRGAGHLRGVVGKER
jgi:hypothetical protein